jgi:hypothetical protein
MPAKRKGRWTMAQPLAGRWYWCRNRSGVQGVYIISRVTWWTSVECGWLRWSEPIKPPEVPKRG